MKKSYIIILIVLFLIFAGIGFVSFTAVEQEDEADSNDQTNNHFDVIVISGEPEGVSAAVSAARRGAEVLLIEHRSSLGGLITYGMLNYLDIPQNDDRVTVSQGIFQEWHELVGGSQVITVDLQEAEKAFHQLVEQEENIRLLLETEVTDVVLEENTLTGIETTGLSGESTYTAERFIDATPDGDIAVKAGSPYFTGQQDINKEDKMAATLMIYLDQVDWSGVKEAANSGVFGGAGITESAAWGFPEVLFAYEEVVEGDKTNMRGLNIGRTPNGEIFINALQIFDVDGLDEQSRQQGIEAGIKEIEHFIPWLRDSLPGFSNAQIVQYPEELYVRETRHIESEYMLPVSALWENEHHWDDIAIGGYPADIQATAPTNYGTITVNPNQFGIPFRSLIPLEVEHLLVASKASGYSSLAAGSARIIPTGMATAEAAGVASVLSIEADVDFRAMSQNETLIQQLQNRLTEQGAYLQQLDNPVFPYQGEAYYPALKNLYTYDLIFGGYDNDFYLDELMKADRFIEKLVNGLTRLEIDVQKKTLSELAELQLEIEEEMLQDIHIETISQLLKWEEASMQDGDPWSRLEAVLYLEENLWRGFEE